MLVLQPLHPGRVPMYSFIRTGIIATANPLCEPARKPERNDETTFLVECEPGSCHLPKRQNLWASKVRRAALWARRHQVIEALSNLACIDRLGLEIGWNNGDKRELCRCLHDAIGQFVELCGAQY